MFDFEIATFSIEDDFDKVMTFLDKIRPRNKYLLWESGRMNFWKSSLHGNKEPSDPFFRKNVKLWKSSEELVGLFISEYGKNDFFFVVSEEHQDVCDSLFSWIDEEWSKDKECLETDVFEGDEQVISVLVNNGFAFKSHTENRRFYDLNKTGLHYHLDEGFLVMPFYQYPNIESRVAVVKST